jgi:hypothetical protein
MCHPINFVVLSSPYLMNPSRMAQERGTRVVSSILVQNRRPEERYHHLCEIPSSWPLTGPRPQNVGGWENGRLPLPFLSFQQKKLSWYLPFVPPSQRTKLFSFSHVRVKVPFPVLPTPPTQVGAPMVITLRLRSFASYLLA